MKKFALTALAAATMLGAGAAHAYTTGTYSNGFVVPHVYHNGPGDTTAIGIINRSGDSVPVYWAFFDENSRKVQDSCFEMTANAFEPFIWSGRDKGNLVGQHGYMVFAGGIPGQECNVNADTDSFEEAADIRLSGAAYQVTTNNMNAETVPTLNGPLSFAPGTNLMAMNPNSLTSVGGAFNNVARDDDGDLVGVSAAAVRFYNPGNTEWVLWSTGDQRVGSAEHEYTVNTYDFNQLQFSASLKPKNRELNIFDVKDSDGQISSWPLSFREGFSVIDTASGGTGNGWGSWYAYARIAQADGANVQTYLGVEE